MDLLGIILTERIREERKVQALDGGWAWVVFLGSFLSHVIADGIVYSFGIFYVEFLDYFQSGKGETAWAGSLITGMMLIVGPLGSVLINKYGCRVTSLIGVLLATLGFILTIFSPNLYFLFFSFGIISGIGFGLIYLPSIVIIGLYFERRRALALGMSIAGSGIGVFIFSPVSEVLIDQFGWRGALLLEAGFVLNCAVCATLFRPLKVPDSLHTKRRKDPDKKKKQKTRRKFSDLYEKEDYELCVNTGNYLDMDNSHIEFVLITPSASPITKFPPTPPVQTVFVSEGAVDSPVGSMDDSEVKKTLLRMISTDSSVRHVFTSDPDLVMSRKDSDRRQKLFSKSSDDDSIPDVHVSSLNKTRQSVPSGKEASETPCDESKTPFLQDKPISSIVATTEVDDNSANPPTCVCDISLLRNRVFMLYVLSNFCTSLVIDSLFIFMADRAFYSGVTLVDSKWILSAMGITNTIGKALVGFISNFKGVNRLWFYISTLVLTGVTSALCPLYNNYTLLMIYGCAVGLFVGWYVSLTSVVLIDLVGKQLMTNGFGILLLFKGIAILVGPPLSGWYYDLTGSYDTTYIVVGVVLTLSGVMLFLIPLVQKRQSVCGEC